MVGMRMRKRVERWKFIARLTFVICSSFVLDLDGRPASWEKWKIRLSQNQSLMVLNPIAV